MQTIANAFLFLVFFLVFGWGPWSNKTGKSIISKMYNCREFDFGHVHNVTHTHKMWPCNETIWSIWIMGLENKAIACSREHKMLNGCECEMRVKEIHSESFKFTIKTQTTDFSCYLPKIYVALFNGLHSNAIPCN